MTHIANWLSPESLRLLALALLHFLWQGAALAALAYVAMGLCRRAAVRYVIGVGTLALMVAAPIGTVLILRERPASDWTANVAAANDNFVRVGPGGVVSMHAAPARGNGTTSPYLLWLVEAWFAGVVLLSIRAGGGFLLVERLRRRESTALAADLEELCRSLQRRMGLDRAIRYCESMQLVAPAVVGWLRPVVMLPAAAITGFTQEQLEAVIAHELAHIRRHDAFVHLFQVAAETLLFYHPAVWWLGRRIRAEREHCCDDVAVEVCGSAISYAHALTRMAEWKAAPQMVMAANRSPLVERIARLLGATRSSETFRGANLSAGVLCLLTALLAGSAFVGNVRHVQAQTPAPAPETQAAEPPAAREYAGHAPRVPDSAFVVRPNAGGTDSSPATEPTEIEASVSSQNPAPQAPPSAKQGYIESLKDAGLSDLSVDDLIGLKVQGVTAEYVKAMKDLGISMDAGELIGMKVQGITPEYVKQMRGTTGEKLDSGELIGMKVQGVTPEYFAQMRDLGLKVDAGEIIGMKVQGITPEYVRELRGLGLNVDSDSIIGMKVQGVTPQYVKSFQNLGFHPDADEIVGMKVQGITADYIKGLQSAGFKVDIDDAIGAKVQGVTPEFIEKVRSHGFKDLTLEKIIQLKTMGILNDEK